MEATDQRLHTRLVVVPLKEQNDSSWGGGEGGNIPEAKKPWQRTEHTKLYTHLQAAQRRKLAGSISLGYHNYAIEAVILRPRSQHSGALRVALRTRLKLGAICETKAPWLPLGPAASCCRQESTADRHSKVRDEPGMAVPRVQRCRGHPLSLAGALPSPNVTNHVDVHHPPPPRTFVSRRRRSLF